MSAQIADAPPATSAEHAAFLAERATGIGGSDAGAALGLNKHCSAYRCWEEKVGLREPDDLSQNPAVRWGIILEPSVADAFSQETGLELRRVNQTLRHPKHRFMMAHLDRRIVGKKWGLEVKTTGIRSANQWGAPGTDEVPEYYLLQTMHYMAITDYELFYIAVLIGGQDFRIYVIPRNDELIARMIEREAAFWDLVERKVAPPIVSIEDARRAFPIATESTLDCSERPDVYDAVKRLRKVARLEAALKERKSALQGTVCGFLGSHDTLTRGDRRLLTWKTVNRKGYVVEPSSYRTIRLAGEKE